MRRVRSAIVATAIALSFGVLAATSASATPPHATIVDNADGTVTLTYADVPAPGVNPGVYFCAGSVAPADCRVDGPTTNIRYFTSASVGMGSSPVTFAEGSSLFLMDGGDPVDLPAGVYTMTYWITTGATVVASAPHVVIGSPHDATPPPPPWVQSYGRLTADATCQSGWSPSWEQWPNGGQGGYVCTREIPSLGN